MSRRRERIIFGAAIIFGGPPFGGDPALMLEFVERGVERAFADLEHVAGDLLQANADSPAVEGFQRQDLQEKKIEGALDKVGWPTHVGSSR